MDVPSEGVILERKPCHGPSTGIMISGISSTGSATSSTLKTFGPPKIFIGFLCPTFIETLRWVRLPRTIATLYHALRHR